MNSKKITRNYLESYFSKKGNVVLSKKRTKTCFLLLHGMGVLPDIYDNLVNYLSKNINSDFYIPIQRFSKNSNETSVKQDYKSWVKDGLSFYNKLNKYYDEVYLVGHSLGGSVAFNMSSQLKINNLILLSTPLCVDKKILFSSKRNFNKTPFIIKFNIFVLIFKNYFLISKMKYNLLYCLGLNDETVSINSAKKIKSSKSNFNFVEIQYLENCAHSEILRNKIFAKRISLEIIKFLKKKVFKKQSFKKQK